MLKKFLSSLVKLENIKTTHADDNELANLISQAQVRLLSQASVAVRTYRFTDVDIEEMKRGSKVPTIKRVREATGMGLAEAKNFVEKWMTDKGIPLYPSSGQTYDGYGYR